MTSKVEVTKAQTLLGLYRNAKGENGKFQAIVEKMGKAEVTAIANYYRETLEPEEAKGIIATLRTTLSRVNKAKGETWTIAKPKGAKEYSVAPLAKPRGRQATGKARQVGAVMTLQDVLSIVAKFGEGLEKATREQYADAVYDAAIGQGRE